MATLAAINDTLEEQNKFNKASNENLKKLSNSLIPFIRRDRGRRLDDLESIREGGTQLLSKAGGLLDRGYSRIESGAQRAIGGLPSLANIGAFLTPLALAGLAAKFGKSFLKKGLPAALVGLFADEIADFIIGPEGNKELREAIASGLTFAAVGSIFGKRFALIGAAFGFLVDDKEKVFDELKKTIDELKEKFDFGDLRAWIQTNLIEGLEGIRMLFQGDLKGVWKEGKILETLGLLAALGAVLAPTAAIGLLLKGPRLAFWLGGKGLKGVGFVLKQLGNLGTSIAGLSIPRFGGLPAGVTRGPSGELFYTGKDGKATTRRYTPKPGVLGRTGALLARGARGALSFGPAGLAILAAAGIGAGVVIAGSTLAGLAEDSFKNSSFGQFLRGNASSQPSALQKDNRAAEMAMILGGDNVISPAVLDEINRLKSKIDAGTASQGDIETYNRRISGATQFRLARQNVNIDEIMRARQEAQTGAIDPALIRAATGMTNISDNSFNQRIENNMATITSLKATDAISMGVNQ
tara:strand:- start:3732 stop:5303 length:1572 start_codon:yes stop_codon:yes gene_type:complete